MDTLPGRLSGGGDFGAGFFPAGFFFDSAICLTVILPAHFATRPADLF
jgi:hypothetical protein